MRRRVGKARKGGSKKGSKKEKREVKLCVLIGKRGKVGRSRGGKE